MAYAGPDHYLVVNGFSTSHIKFMPISMFLNAGQFYDYENNFLLDLTDGSGRVLVLWKLLFHADTSCN